MKSKKLRSAFDFFFFCFSISCLFFVSCSFANGGEVSISSIGYPAAPETVAAGEIVPIIVNINYADLSESILVAFITSDSPPFSHFSNEVTFSGSGTYKFPPMNLVVTSDSSMISGWPEYIHEWHMMAEIREAVAPGYTPGPSRVLTRKPFTLLVENPAKKPIVEISKIDFVSPPDTIAVDEETLVKIHMVYSNLDPGTDVEATLRDQMGLLASQVTRGLSGSGESTFAMTITPKKAENWRIEAVLATVSGSLPFGDKTTFQILVV